MTFSETLASSHVVVVVVVRFRGTLRPGLSDETVQLVRVDVDLDAPENRNPSQELEGSEFITVLRVPKKGLRRRLDALAGEGLNVFAGLYTLALGMELNE